VHGFIAALDDGLATRCTLPAVVRDREAGAAARALRLHFVPRAHRLTLVETQEVFVDQTVPQIIKQKLELCGLQEGTDFALLLGGTYLPRESVVQYRESDLAFIQRLCEHAGIAYHFDHESGVDKLVFSDHNAAFGPAEVEAQRFDDRGGIAIASLESKKRLVAAMYAVQDYNYRTPLIDVVAQEELVDGYGGGIVEYAPHVKTPGEARDLARMRAQAANVKRESMHGTSGVPSLAAGRRFCLVDHPILPESELFVTALTHHYASPALAADGGYKNELTAIAAATPFRPALRTPKPRIHGFLTAVVDPLEDAAPGAREATPRIDEEGRYFVRFHFDGGPLDRVKISRPVRMMQSHAGAGYGTHFPLRPGVEVLVAFLDGDPDRPVIVGAVPNALTPSPIGARNAAQNRIVTASGVTLSIRDF
ncbi:MAG: type VI secretion system tip protein VgrG, partial [Myxococcales bacterium]|nr:type VI secretion system tip protein VgrG [Myxococcales bacterium]